MKVISFGVYCTNRMKQTSEMSGKAKSGSKPFHMKKG